MRKGYPVQVDITTEDTLFCEFSRANQYPGKAGSEKWNLYGSSKVKPCDGRTVLG